MWCVENFRWFTNSSQPIRLIGTSVSCQNKILTLSLLSGKTLFSFCSFPHVSYACFLHNYLQGSSLVVLRVYPGSQWQFCYEDLCSFSKQYRSLGTDHLYTHKTIYFTKGSLIFGSAGVAPHQWYNHFYLKGHLQMSVLSNAIDPLQVIIFFAMNCSIKYFFLKFNRRPYWEKSK